MSHFPCVVSVKAAWRSKEGAYASPPRESSTLDGKDEREQQITLINAGFPHYNLTNVFATPVHCAPLPALWSVRNVTAALLRAHTNKCMYNFL